ncbi:uncharacterized protein G2W53_001475 [Senna tora]|uniref:Uncharacterized protein n=1 Tax=Senna tora TaxID=362788 RepID=A0A834XFL6_9FABA|nr:uncharacterized protein G2W53_001475 [Senna tora]
MTKAPFGVKETESTSYFLPLNCDQTSTKHLTSINFLLLLLPIGHIHKHFLMDDNAPTEAEYYGPTYLNPIDTVPKTGGD